jgi:thioredoxin-like negative regulator of GroEL
VSVRRAVVEAFTDARGDDLARDRGLPVAALFWAEWCLPSRSALESLATMADTLDGRLALGAVDVEAAPRLVERHAVRGLPTMIVFAGGKEWARRVGLMARDDLRQFLERALSA